MTFRVEGGAGGHDGPARGGADATIAGRKEVAMPRIDGREPDALRPISIEVGFLLAAAGGRARGGHLG